MNVKSEIESLVTAVLVIVFVLVASIADGINHDLVYLRHRNSDWMIDSIFLGVSGGVQRDVEG